MKGGSAIGSGGFGCVFKPAIKCKESNNTYNKKPNGIHDRYGFNIIMVIFYRV
jgi:hypothetical protein